MPRDMPDSYNALFSEDEPTSKQISTSHLSLSLPNLSFSESIQYFVTDSSISSNTYTQLVFPSSDFLGAFPKLLKTFATSYMDNRKYISSGNSIGFDESTKRYAHSIGVQKIQTTPKNACKYDGA